ncbi:MAG: SH3 domain-containing protein [Pseudomonadales bacterium]|nr:SH3 domain-containing protein [Pseudomonadales bacterium]
MTVITVVVLAFAIPNVAEARYFFSKKTHPKVTVASPPFIEMRTGPGRGYPLFYVVERGDKVEVLKEKTEWFKVRNRKGTEGWVSRENLAMTLSAAGNLVALRRFGLEDFENMQWELGVQGGNFGGAPLVSGLLAYRYAQNLSVELSVNQASGNLSNNLFATVNVLNQPFPHWRVSPYFMLGIGKIRTKLNKTLVQSPDRDNELLLGGVGARIFITKRFIFRLEYRNYVALTNQSENDEIEEWKMGFGVFF